MNSQNFFVFAERSNNKQRICLFISLPLEKNGVVSRCDFIFLYAFSALESLSILDKLTV